jgi:hypothetical protein
MNQNRLQQKRRKRQAKRKEAQGRARRRNIEASRLRDKTSVPYSLPGSKPATPSPGFLGRLFGGTQVAPDQMDTEAAPIVQGESS